MHIQFFPPHVQIVYLVKTCHNVASNQGRLIFLLDSPPTHTHTVNDGREFFDDI